MTREDSINWLHLSDVHLSSTNPYDADVVVGTLLASLPALIARSWTPDFVVFSGDLANKGKQAEYARATDFLDRLLTVLNLPRGCLFVVPGNHDIDRARGKGLTRTLSNSVDADEYFDDGESLLHVEQRQSAYGDWYDSYFSGIRAFEAT